jgi:steroid 5-alpha reductase family enzyme
MSDSGGSGVNALAVVAIVLVLAGAGYWFVNNQSGRTQRIDVNVEAPKVPPAPTTP